MIARIALLALALHAAPDPLAPARDAFAAGDYARAESLALFAAVPPHRGQGLYLAALARFRAGRSEDALAALDAAARAKDAPPRGPWQFNRGACLYALERFDEAEAAFLAAAEADPSLAAAARAQAGFAALDGDEPERARAHAAAAKATATGSTLALVEELEASVRAAAPSDAADARLARAAAAYRSALAAFDEGRFAEARRGFMRAAQLDPRDGRAALMAGASEVRLGAREDARADLIRALSLRLDPGEVRIARDYLAEASYGLGSRPQGFGVSTHAGVAYDDNVLQYGGVGIETAPVLTRRVDSLQYLAGAAATYRWRPRPAVAVDVAYGVEQSAYDASDAEDYGVQQHVAAAAVEATALPRLRLGALASYQASFTGRSRFRALDLGPGVGVWVAFDAHDAATTRLDLEWSLASSRFGPREFNYLFGDRLELAVAQQIRLGPIALDASWRHRVEWLGDWELRVFSWYDDPVTGTAKLRETQRFEIPFGSTTDTLALAARAQLGRVQLAAVGGYGWRRYHDDSVTTTSSPVDAAPPVVAVRRRRDGRLFAGAAATYRVLPWLSVTGRFDVTVNRSNLALGDGAAHANDYDNKNYTKNVVALETGIAW